MNEALGVDFKYFLTYRSVKTEIFTPDGWDEDTIISYKRDTFYFGIIRSFALPLSFVENGASILRNAYARDGVQAGVIFEAQQLNRSTLQYQPFFIGDIDFSQKDDSADRFSVTLMLAGSTERIKAYESTKYEFDLIGDDVVNIVLPGVAFSDGSQSIITPVIETPVNHKRYIPESNVIINQSASGFITSQTTDYEDVADNSFSGSPNWFVRYEKTIELNISGSVKGYFKKGVSATAGGFDIRIMDSGNNVVKTLYSNPGTSGFTIPFEFEIDETITKNAGDKLFLYFRVDGNTDNKGIFIDEGGINVAYNSVSDPSNCKALRGLDLFRRIMRRIDSASNVDSFLLQNTWRDLLFTSGNAIREIPGAKIKTSLKDFFQTFNALDDVGMGPENNILRLENKPFFARPALSVDVGEIGDKACTLSYASQFAASGAKLGYNDGNTEDKNGLQEYNSGQIWEWPITRLQNTFDWVSVARADQFGIEKIRVDYNVKREKGTNDTPSDNDMFMIDCYQDGASFRPILGSSYALVTGLLNGATAYNLRITPKKNLLRHGAYLRSIMSRMDTYYINFASADKNQELRTVKDGVSVTENENIRVGNLQNPYFLPDIATIKCKLPISANLLFDNLQFGFVRFNWRGNDLRGFILECNVDIAKNSEQEFKLLLTPDNNLLNLTNL